MSETANIAAALAKFQAEMPIVPKAHTAKVPTKSGGSYSYTYAGLADVTEAAVPILAKYGLSFATFPRATERGYELVGRLLHESGEALEGALPISGNTPQELGSSLTYMRRYLFGCMTGLVTDDDDDGAMASRPKKRAGGEPKPVDDKPMQAGTRGAMFAEFARVGIPEHLQLAGINNITGKDYTSRGELLESDAKAVIADLKGRPSLPQEAS